MKMNSVEIFKKLTKGIKFQNTEVKSIVDGTAKKVNVSPKLSRSDQVAILSGAEDLDHKPASSKKKRSREKRNKKDQIQIRLEQHQEQVNRLRKLHGIHIRGTDVNEPIRSFEKLAEDHGVSELLCRNLQSQGYNEPTAIQMQAWPLMLSRREILACAPTGSGKTAAFLIPVLHHLSAPQKKGFRAVVVSPTRELAKQTYRECLRLSEGTGLRIHFMGNANKTKEKATTYAAHKYDILIATPNRLVFTLQSEDVSFSLENVEWLIVDESDRLFESGERGFRDQLAVIYAACSSGRIRRALFSATFAMEVERWCQLNLDNVAMVSVGARNSANSDVVQVLTFCGDESGKLFALRDILRKGYEPPVLIFVQSKERAKELFKELYYDKLLVDVIHADKTLAQRDEVVQLFRERKLWVLICTELMARGIDFKGINLVINYDFPPSNVSYIHRVGRTGRAQRQGRAVTFWTLTDKQLLRSIAQVINDSGQQVPEWMLQLKKLSKSNKEKLSKMQPERGHVSVAVERMARDKKQKVNWKKRPQGGKLVQQKAISDQRIVHEETRKRKLKSKKNDASKNTRKLKLSQLD